MDSTLDHILTTSHSVLGLRETWDGINSLPTRSCLVSGLVLTRSCILPSLTDLVPISPSERRERKRWQMRSCEYVGNNLPPFWVFTEAFQGATNNSHILEERVMNNVEDRGV